MQSRIQKSILYITLAALIATAFVPFIAVFAAQLAPTVTTVSATDITLKQVMLNATVNPNEEQTLAWFEYGATISFSKATDIQSAGSQSNPSTIRAHLSTLESGTTYYFRIVAQNKFGTNYGITMSFTTGGGQPSTNPPVGSYTPPNSYLPPYNSPQPSYGTPAITTLSAASVSQTFVSLNGTVYPNGYATNAWFEWGASAALGNSAGTQFISNTATYSSYTYALATLMPNTTYYYRAAAQNAYGTVYGQIISFTTHTSGNATTNSSGSSSSSAGGLTSIFKSSSNTTPKPVDPGALNLSSALNRTQPWPGSKIEYAVHYTNTGAGTLTAIATTVELPFEVQYVSSDVALREQNGNVLTFDLPSLKGRKETAFVIASVVKGPTEIGSPLTFKTTLDYTDATNKRHSKETSVNAVVIAANKAPSILALVFGGASGSVSQWLLMVTAFLAALAIYNGIRRAITGFGEPKI